MNKTVAPFEVAQNLEEKRQVHKHKKITTKYGKG